MNGLVCAEVCTCMGDTYENPMYFVDDDDEDDEAGESPPHARDWAFLELLYISVS